MESRRAIMKMLGIAPAAAISARSEIAAMLANPPAAAAMSAVGMASTVAQGGIGGPFARFGAVVAKQMDDLATTHQEEFNARRILRGNSGLDADIAALRSTSTAYRHRKQIERDLSDSDLMRQIQKMMWG